ncbi:MAG: hypothetical protein WBX19_14675 [Terracidiphilus sp.]
MHNSAGFTGNARQQLLVDFSTFAAQVNTVTSGGGPATYTVKSAQQQ